MELHPQVSPDEIISRDMELGCESWTSFVSGCSSTAVHDIVLVTLPSTAVETAVALCTGCWAMAREHHLNTSIVLAAVHGLSGPFLVISAVEPSLSCPLPPPPPPPHPSIPVPNKQPHFCGRKAIWSSNAYHLTVTCVVCLHVFCLSEPGLEQEIS